MYEFPTGVERKAAGDGPHTGAMIALIPSETDAHAIAVDQEDLSAERWFELHVTLAFLGEASSISETAKMSILSFVQKMSQEWAPFDARCFAVNVFNPKGEEPCVVLGVGGNELLRPKNDVWTMIEHMGNLQVPDNHAPWVPHMTLKYFKDGIEWPLVAKIAENLPETIRIAAIRVAFGGNYVDFPLSGEEPDLSPVSDEPEIKPTTVYEKVISQDSSVCKFCGAKATRKVTGDNGKSLFTCSEHTDDADEWFDANTDADRVTVEKKAVRHVRTPAGVRRFNQPIGSVIIADGHSLPNLKVTGDSEYEGWVKVKGTNGKNYEVGKDGDKWYATGAEGGWDDIVAQGDSEESVYKALNATIGKKTSNSKKPGLEKDPADSYPNITRVESDYEGYEKFEGENGKNFYTYTEGRTTHIVDENDKPVGSAFTDAELYSQLNKLGKKPLVVSVPTGKGTSTVSDSARKKAEDALYPNLKSVETDYDGWEKYKGSDGKDYYLGRADDGSWSAVDANDKELGSGSRQEALKALNSHVSGSGKGDAPKNPEKAPKATVKQVQDDIVDAYVARFAESNDYRSYGANYMMISDLRKRLADRGYSREQFDEAIRGLDHEGGAILVPESNQKVLTEEERAGAVMVGNQPQHLIEFSSDALKNYGVDVNTVGKKTTLTSSRAKKPEVKKPERPYADRQAAIDAAVKDPAEFVDKMSAWLFSDKASRDDQFSKQRMKRTAEKLRNGEWDHAQAAEDVRGWAKLNSTIQKGKLNQIAFGLEEAASRKMPDSEKQKLRDIDTINKLRRTDRASDAHKIYRAALAQYVNGTIDNVGVARMLRARADQPAYAKYRKLFNDVADELTGTPKTSDVNGSKEGIGGQGHIPSDPDKVVLAKPREIQSGMMANIGNGGWKRIGMVGKETRTGWGGGRGAQTAGQYTVFDPWGEPIAIMSPNSTVEVDEGAGVLKGYQPKLRRKPWPNQSVYMEPGEAVKDQENPFVDGYPDFDNTIQKIPGTKIRYQEVADPKAKTVTIKRFERGKEDSATVIGTYSYTDEKDSRWKAFNDARNLMNDRRLEEAVKLGKDKYVWWSVPSQRRRDPNTRKAPNSTTAPKGDSAVGKDNQALSSATPAEHYEAMKPTSTWTEEKRQSILDSLRSTEQGRVLAETLDRFQDGGSIARLRTAIEKHANGEGINPTTAARVEALQQYIRDAPEGWAPATLYRGMAIKGSLDHVLAKYEPGQAIKLNLTSFSSDRAAARRFQDMTRTNGSTRVMVELIGDKKKVIPIQNMARDRRLFKEKEWVSAGNYVVKEVKKAPDGSVLIRITQESAL